MIGIIHLYFMFCLTYFNYLFKLVKQYLINPVFTQYFLDVRTLCFYLGKPFLIHHFFTAKPVL